MSAIVQLRQNLRVHGVNVRFSTPIAEHLATLAVDYGPFYVPDTAGDADDTAITFTVDFAEDPQARHPTDTRIAGPLGDTIAVTADGSARVFGPSIGNERAYTTEIRAYLTAMVLRRLVTSRVAQQFHASAVEGRRGAVLFAGAKKMGKSSMALLATLGGASYMSNDITLLSVADQVEVLGLPQPLTIGLGAANWFAAQQPSSELDTSQIGEGLDDHELYSLEIGEKQILTRAGLTRLGGTVRTTPCPLSAIIFPEPNLNLDCPRVRLLDRDEAMTRLAMLAEAFLKWECPVALDADAYLARMRTVLSAAAETASCYHLQWCPDHGLNLKLMREVAL